MFSNFSASRILSVRICRISFAKRWWFFYACISPNSELLKHEWIDCVFRQVCFKTFSLKCARVELLLVVVPYPQQLVVHHPLNLMRLLTILQWRFEASRLNRGTDPPVLAHASGLPEHSPGCHQCVIPLVQQSERDFPSCFQSFVHLSDGMERPPLFIHRNVHFHGTIFLAMIPPVSLPKTGVQWTCPNHYQIPKIHPKYELSRWYSVARSVLQIPKSLIFAMVSSRSFSACAVTHELLNDWVKDFVELRKGAVTDSGPVQSWDWTTGLHARTWAKCFG